MEAAHLAMNGWIRVAANMSLGAYEVFQAVAELPEPEWPETTFQEVLRIGFKGKFVQDTDHPVVRRLRGEM